MLDIATVDFSGDGDGVTAVYINGKLHTYGDYYHDKIDDWIRGFCDGLTYARLSLNRKHITVSRANLVRRVSENGESPPKKLTTITDGTGWKIG